MKKWNWIVLAGVVVLSVLIFASIRDAGPLTWDDDSNIFGNPYFTMHMWWGVWTEPYFGLYVPVTSSVWAALFYLGHGAAWPFRALNVALHAANIVLVFLLLRGLGRRWNLRSPVAAGLAVAVFALHPLQTEAVAWISGGRDLLSAFFALACTAVYFGWSSRKGYCAAFALFVLALLSKPSVVVLPLAFIAGEFFLNKKSLRAALWPLLPWFALSLLATLATHGAQVGHFEDVIPWWERPWVMADTYFFYLQKLVWPFPLAGNYGHTPEKVIADFSGAWKAAALVVLTGIWAFWAWRRDRRLWVGVLWFVFLLPVSGLVAFAYANISGVADHYVYLPMAVVAVFLMLLWESLWKWRVLTIVPLLLIGGWAWASWERLEVWESDINFFTDMAKNAPDSYNTALGMSVILCQDVKDYDGGIAWTEKALRMHENDILALANRAFCLLQGGRPKGVLEMEFYLQKLDTDNLAANQPTAYSSLLASIGSALIQEHEFEDGFQYLCEAYRVKPAEPNHARNLQAATEILKQQGLVAVCDPD